MSLQSASALALTLILLLFAIAAIVEARSGALAKRPRLRHATYTLALGVYCTSWTFYGAVGSAVRDGWSYLPIYAAPIVLLLAAPKFLRRLSEAVADEQATTVSDFIAARFSHDIVVARLVRSERGGLRTHPLHGPVGRRAGKASGQRFATCSRCSCFAI